MKSKEIDALQPGQWLTYEPAPGLRIEATAKYRSWTYRYKSPVDGRMRQVQLGRWPGMTLAAALAAWGKLRSERDAGRDPALQKKAQRADEREAQAARQRRRGAPTVAEVCADYMVHVRRSRKKKGADEVERLFDKLLGDFAGRLAVETTRTDAFDLLERLAATPVQASHLRGELGGAWDYALDAGRLPPETPNWWRQIKRGKLQSKGRRLQGEHIGTAKRVLSDDEVSTLLRWLPNFSKLVHDALVLYLWTCARGAEITAMRGDEVREEETGLWWTVPKAKTKNARITHAGDLRVPLVGRAAAVVRRRKEVHGDGYLFPSRGRYGHVEQKTIGAGVHYHMPYSNAHPDCFRPRLPVERWAPHDLRRTGRTMLSALRCPRDVAEVIVGHVLPGVEGVYNRHHYDAERREWLTKLSDRLEELASGA